MVVASPNVAGGGSAFLFNGSPSGLTSTPSWNAEGNAEGDKFGASLAGGDFNNDGYSDLAIGAPGLNAGAQPNTGGVYVFAGQADATPTPTPSATAVSPVCLGTATPVPTSSAPGPTAGLLERQIANCYDDAHERTDVGVVYPLLDTVTTGGTTDWARYSGGFLFRNIEIPPRPAWFRQRSSWSHATSARCRSHSSFPAIIRGTRRTSMVGSARNQRPSAHVVGTSAGP